MRRMYAAFAAILLAFGATAVSADTASAYAYNCTTGYSSLGAWAKCVSGTGQYRVAVLCQNIFTRSSRNVYGQWVTPSSTSVSVVPGCGTWLEAYYGTPRATSGQ